MSLTINNWPGDKICRGILPPFKRKALDGGRQNQAAVEVPVCGLLSIAATYQLLRLINFARQVTGLVIKPPDDVTSNYANPMFGAWDQETKRKSIVSLYSVRCIKPSSSKPRDESREDVHTWGQNHNNRLSNDATQEFCIPASRGGRAGKRHCKDCRILSTQHLVWLRYFGGVMWQLETKSIALIDVCTHCA